MPRKHKITGNHTSDPFDEQFSPQTDTGADNKMEQAEFDAAYGDGRETASPYNAFHDGNQYHEAGKREVEMYIRTYNTLLRSSGEISLKALVQAHYNIDSSLHPDARSPYPDMSAFIYSVLRLPSSIIHCDLVLLGQSEDVFLQQGFQVDSWQAVTASARRRKWFYDGKNTLAAYVASVSDTDDIVPILVAFQIEWNKMYYLLNADPTTMQILETRMDHTSPVFIEIQQGAARALAYRSR